MYQVIIVIHIILGLGIIGLILMQHGKGADAGATFGGGASGSVFGAQGAASFLSRTTAILATLFFVTSLGLAFLNSHKSADITDLMSSPSVEKAPAELPLPAVDGAKTEKTAPAPAEKKGLESGVTDKPSPPVTPESEPAATAPAAASPVVDKPVADIPNGATQAAPGPAQPATVETSPAVEEKVAEPKADVPAKAPERKKK